MAHADVKVEGQHFRLFAGIREGPLAHVYDFTANQDALFEKAPSLKDAKLNAKHSYVEELMIARLSFGEIHSPTLRLTADCHEECRSPSQGAQGGRHL